MDRGASREHGRRRGGDSLSESIRRLRAEWSERARSPRRDFFVASHAGWEDPAAWRAQARVDLEFILDGLSAPRLAAAEVLEIGCGVGRLAEGIASRVRGYTGLDIAPGMVDEARRRATRWSDPEARARCRFLVADGASLPDEAVDRGYDLVLAHAVFIHCPREVVAALVSSAWEVLARGGELRAQFLVEPGPIGAPLPAATDRAHEAAAGPTVSGGFRDPTGYMGHVFSLAELSGFLAARTAGVLRGRRTAESLAYVGVTRPG